MSDSDYTLKPLSANTQTLIDVGRARYMPNYNPREFILDHGKGARLWDLDGNEYIDFTSGIGVNSLGHHFEPLLEALRVQAGKLWHTSNVFFTEPAIRLAEALTEKSGLKRVYFSNSGAEAIEAAIKICRKHASLHHPAGKRGIITCHGSFHGRTYGAMTATAQPKYQEGFEPLPGGFSYAAYNDLASLEKMMDENTCAVIFEPVQGEGGVRPATAEFIRGARALCNKYEALLVFDQIQCGMGRTGDLFSHSFAGVEPDLITLAKALGCGFPIGAVLVGEKAQNSLPFGSHGTTFGGNPLATAVAGVALEHLSSPELLENVRLRGEDMRSWLKETGKKLGGVFAEVRGRGLMTGAELTSDFQGKAGEITLALREHGVLALVAGPDVLRFLPPLNITEEEMSEGLSRVGSGLAAYFSHA